MNKALPMTVRSSGTTVLAAVVSGALVLTSGLAFSATDEIVVVSTRKKEENLQEVPLSITALGADDINRLGIKDLTTVTQQDTSVQFDEGFTPSDTRITIRGLSPTRGRPNAATLVDGIDVTSEAVSNAGGSLLINPRLLDVARIEIVKGPQSALFGRSAFAGAIQYITKDPSDVFEANLTVEHNTEDAKEISGNMSFPINDELGVIVNGLIWDARGIHRNTATDAYVGGGDGVGTSVTFKYEPTDNVDFKWRTEYTDDHYDVSPQVLLSKFNKWYDLGNGGQLERVLAQTPGKIGGINMAPNSGNCTDAMGNPVNSSGNPSLDSNGVLNPAPGPLDNPNCNETLHLFNYYSGDPSGNGDATFDLGQYDPNEVFDFNRYNKQIANLFVGEIPDGNKLQVALRPNYAFGPGAINPQNAIDNPGVDKEVFRTSLVTNWDLNDMVSLTSYSSYTDASVHEVLDLSKNYVDECGPDINAIANQVSPLDPSKSYYDELVERGLNPAKYAPCSTVVGPDGVGDSQIGFVQNTVTDTQQLSQEFRVSYDINDNINLTGGMLYWKERVEQFSLNSVAISGGIQCYLRSNSEADPYTDSSQNPAFAGFAGLDPNQDQCGRTGLPVAYFQSDLFQGRIEAPDTTKRGTDHLSWYGSLDWDFTDRLSARIEARLTREENEVTGQVQTPCFNRLPANLKKFDPDNPQAADSCTLGGAPNRLAAGAGGQPTGPSAAIICGLVGRCDNVGLASELGSPYYANGLNGPLVPAGAYPNGPFTGTSWWDWGFQGQPFNLQTIDRTDRFWAPKATVEWAATDDVLLYASWSRGIKPGGFSLLTSGAFGLDANLDGNFDEVEFEPERLDVWELGAKSTWLDGKLRLNGSLFYQDFKDKQVTVQFVVANTVGTRVVNISGSEILGLELDFGYLITENFEVSGGYTYLDSEYTDYSFVARSSNDILRSLLGPNGAANACQDIRPVDPALDGPDDPYGCAVSLNGNELERAPKHAANVNLSYNNNLFDTGLEWYAESSSRYQDSRFLENWNIVEFQSYVLTDVRFGIQADTWDVQLFINNVFDDDTVTTGGPNPGLATGSFGIGQAVPPFPGINAGPILPSDVYAQLPNPRIFGVRANFGFGG